MGKYVTKFKSFKEDCFTTTIPILTPRVAGAGMMVSPKTLVAAIIGKLTGEPEHEAGCNCDLCKYRDVKKQAQCEVADQRVKINNFVSKIIPGHKNDNDELTEDEVIYYINWLTENFPEIVWRYEDREGPLYLADRIAASHKSKVDMTLLQILLDNHKLTFLSKNELDEIIDGTELDNNGMIDSWAAMFEIAALRKEREMEGFESALALDIP
jgi:hypothetical protein